MNEKGRWEVYRVVLERCTYQNGILSANEYHPEHAEWFAEYVEEVAKSGEVSEFDLRALLCSEDPFCLANGYRELAMHYGAHEFDSYPLIFKYRSEVEERYKDIEEHF